MTLLIATDEAGYGPRLGPLVIVATAWRLVPGHEFEAAHQRLAEPIGVGSLGKIRIDDSKRIFQQKKASAGRSAASAIDLVTDAVATWIASAAASDDFPAWLMAIAPQDVAGLARQPWFASLDETGSTSAPPAQTTDPRISPMIAPENRRILVEHWSAGGLELVGAAARIIDAARFNSLLASVGNKADLLSHATCALAIDLMRRHHRPTDGEVIIRSDRFGGRAYYGGLVQHHCPGFTLRVIAETGRQSDYRLVGPDDRPTITWSFTVGGDSYPPVALSSIIAKSTRERLMGFFNHHFRELASHHPGVPGPLRPTAGYAVDAARFLSDIAPIRLAQGLPDRMLIRSR
jgi:ribonuclease HII